MELTPVFALQGSLRTKATIEKFKAVPVQPGTTSPLLVYFGTLLTLKDKLNSYESVELSRMVLGQNKKHLLDNWYKARTPIHVLRCATRDRCKATFRNECYRHRLLYSNTYFATIIWH